MQSDAQASFNSALNAQYVYTRAPAGPTRTNLLERFTAQPARHPSRSGLAIVPHDEWQVALAARPQGNRRPEADSLALPKPPLVEVRQQPRLPPTLSGLHQPPPEAGLLPSISRQTTAAAPLPAASRPARPKKRIASKQERQERRTTRTRWTEAETSDLMNGVAKFGIGKWTAILNCSEYNFHSRTALDLKDRFRVCRPADYSADHHRSTQHSQAELSSDDLARMGLQAPFEPVSRKKRHHYTEYEDKQLVQGFHRYGKQWARIQQDVRLQLEHRSRTDLRDRLRTKFPELYGQNKTSAVAEETIQNLSDVPPNTLAAPATSASTSQIAHRRDVSAQAAQILPSMPLLELDWSDFRIPASDMERSVTLDRHILNWPQDPTRSTASTLQPSLRDRSGLADDSDKPAHAFLTFEELLS